MKKKIYGAIIFVLLSATVLFAGKSDCVRNLNEIAALVESKGATVNHVQSEYGYLGEGESFIVKNTCYNTVTYFILAAGGNDALDVDIKVYDENGNLVAEDSDDESVAVAIFAPKWTGTFYFKITLYSSSRAGDYVGFVRAYVYH